MSARDAWRFAGREVARRNDALAVVGQGRGPVLVFVARVCVAVLALAWAAS